MTDRTHRPSKFRALWDIAATAPLEFFLSLLMPASLLVVVCTRGPAPESLGAWLASLVFAIPLVLACTTLHRAGRLGHTGRAVGSVFAVGVALPAGWATNQASEPGILLVCYLALAAIAFFLIPVAVRRDSETPVSGDNSLWRHSLRHSLRLALAVGFTTWLSVVLGVVGSLGHGDWAGLAGVAAFCIAFVSTTAITIVFVIARTLAEPREFDARLTGVELNLTKAAFSLSSLATIAGFVALYVVRAYTSGTTLLSHALHAQTGMLVLLAAIGPLALFVGAPFVSGNTDLRSKHLFGLGKLMRLFPPAFLTLMAWSGPAVITGWARYGWRNEEAFGVALLATCTTYCVLRTVFDLLGRRLPLWTMPVVFAFGSVGFAVVTL